MNDNLLSLKGARILVTGASSGIGAACVKKISEFGAAVVLVGRNEARLESVRNSLCAGESAEIVSSDLSHATDYDAIITKGPYSGFVHAAGISEMIPVRYTTADKIKAIFDVNYYAFMEMMRLLVKPNNHTVPFSAVAVSSTSALVGCRGGAAYCGSKGALSASVRAMAVELAPKGIRVNAVCPSMIRTPMFEKSILNGAACDEGTLNRIKSRQPLGLGEAEQVANAVAFLLSSMSSFMTGNNLLVDGGKLAC